MQLLILAAVIVVWFAYGVAHTGKDAATDLIILAATGIPVYLATACVWWLSNYLES